ncbi:hypothetical protein [Methylorubrum aminovorans]
MNAGEKAALSQLARRLVERAKQATSDGNPSEDLKHDTNHFSESGLLLRLLEVEKRIDAIKNEWSKSLTALTSAIERLETRISRLDGEVEALHSKEDSLVTQIQQQRDELAKAAVAFIDLTGTKIEGVLEQVDTLLNRYDAGEQKQNPEKLNGVPQRA